MSRNVLIRNGKPWCAACNRDNCACLDGYHKPEPTDPKDRRIQELEQANAELTRKVEGLCGAYAESLTALESDLALCKADLDRCREALEKIANGADLFSEYDLADTARAALSPQEPK